MKQRIWDRYLEKESSSLFMKAGFGQLTGMGERPAFLIIDVTYGFTGDAPEPVHESIKKYPFSCGEVSWKAIGHIRKLLDTARKRQIPVLYTVIEGEKGISNQNVAVKGTLFDHPNLKKGEKGTQIVNEIAPIQGERVISKKKPSAFFGTPLVTYLTEHQVDTLIVTGCTTSGCVRATVVDAFSYNYQVIVPEEAVFDRVEVSHAISLFDMQQKYADVVSVKTCIEYLESRSNQT